jgi:hypothetical protein
MNNNDLIKRIAQLESLNDQLLSELQFLDSLSKELGFPEGLTSLKATAKELLKEQESEEEQDPPITW